MRLAARLPLLFALGAVLGTAGDQLHVRFGVLTYGRGSPLPFGQPPWVPLLFGATGVALVLGHAPLLRVTRGRSARATALGFALSVLWFYAAYASTAVFAAAPRAVTAALVVAWGARVALAPSADAVLAGILYAFAGPLFESALCATGAFRYTRPDLLLVPIWLPALYLHVSLMTRGAYLVFFRGGRRSSAEGPGTASRG
jgi:Protein of unknown function (DUF2878)